MSERRTAKRPSGLACCLMRFLPSTVVACTRTVACHQGASGRTRRRPADQTASDAAIWGYAL